jgi:hypothetical protein
MRVLFGKGSGPPDELTTKRVMGFREPEKEKPRQDAEAYDCWPDLADNSNLPPSISDETNGAGIKQELRP